MRTNTLAPDDVQYFTAAFQNHDLVQLRVSGDRAYTTLKGCPETECYERDRIFRLTLTSFARFDLLAKLMKLLEAQSYTLRPDQIDDLQAVWQNTRLLHDANQSQ